MVKGTHTKPCDYINHSSYVLFPKHTSRPLVSDLGRVKPEA